MASNRELREQVAILSSELGIEISTEGENNAGLTELVARLQAQCEAREPAPGPAGGAKRAAPADSDNPPATTYEAPPEFGAEDLEEAPQAPPVVDGDANHGYSGGPPKPAKLVKVYPYAVAPGKSIVCQRGVVGPGKEMRACDVGGQEQLDHLVERGHVVKA